MRRIALGQADIYEAWFGEGSIARELRGAETGTLVGPAEYAGARCR